MRKQSRSIFALTLCVCMIAVTSCKNPLSENKPETITAGLCSVSAQPHVLLSRSAVPSTIGSDIRYWATVERAGTYLTGEGTSTEPVYLVNTAASGTPRFTFKQPAHTDEQDYRFTLYVFTDSYTPSASSSQLDTGYRASASVTVRLKAGQATVNAGTLDLIGNSTSGSGKVNLTINLGTTGIQRIEPTVLKNNNTVSPSPFTVTISGGTARLTHTGDGIAAGSYTVILKAYDAQFGGTEVLLHEPVQTITVFSDCTTNTWYGIDGTEISGGLTLSKLSEGEANTFYVKGSGGALPAGISGDDSNSGISLVTPLASVNAALSKCTGSSPYTVYVDGTVEEAPPASQAVISKTVTIKSLAGNARVKKAGGFNTSLIKIASGGKLSLENITLNGAELSAAAGGLIYNEGRLTLKSGVRLEKGKAAHGGAVYNGGTFSVNGSAVIPPDSSAEAGKNDIYLKDGTTITIANSLDPQGGIAARITPETYAATTQVLNGSAVGGEYSKFTVTSDTSGTPAALWLIDNTGHLKKKTYTVKFSVKDGQGGSLNGVCGTENETASGSDIQSLTIPHGGSVSFTANPETDWKVDSWNGVQPDTGSIDQTTARLTGVTEDKTVTVKFRKTTVTINGTGNTATAWKELKEAVENVQDGDTIIIVGEVKATTSGNNNGEIVINKNVTIQGQNGNDSLNANGTTGGKPAHRIFNVSAGGKLTIDGVTLTGGKATGSEAAGNGGAIYNNGGSLILKNSTIQDCAAQLSGGAVHVESGICTVTNCKFTLNTANIGGALYIEKNGICTIGTENGKTTNIYLNGATNGAGIYVASIQPNGCVINDGTIIGGDNTDDHCNEASGSGGGIFIFDNGQCTINEGVIIKNNTAVQNGGGIANYGGSLTIKGTNTKHVIISHCKAEENPTKKKLGGGIFLKKGPTIPTIDMAHVLMEYNEARNGGAVYVEDGILKISGSTYITPSTGSNKDKAGQNDIFLITGKTVTVTGTLTSPSPVARITPKDHTEEIPVLQTANGISLARAAAQFSVTPGLLNSPWHIDAAGKLKKGVRP